MIFKCKNRKLIKIVLLLEAVLLPSVMVFWMVLGKVWTSFDFQILDFFYAQAIQRGYGPPRSSQIVYVTITDDSYAKFGTRLLTVWRWPVSMKPWRSSDSGGCHDLIFPLPMTPAADQRFADSSQPRGGLSSHRPRPDPNRTAFSVGQ
jgi:hypothetical protein